mgnify:CR=1 FL=1
MKATKIMMKSSNSSNSLLEIDSIYIDELCRLIKKEELYDKIEYENWKVNVDNLLCLPKVEI